MSKLNGKAHEHFCSMCYGHKTNGFSGSGWVQCTKKPCTLPREAPCKKHEEYFR